MRPRAVLLNTLHRLTLAVVLVAPALADPGSAGQAQPPAQPGGVGAAASYEGLTVETIDFPDVPAPQNKERMAQLVVQPTGRPLDRDLVRKSLQAIYATGRFADVRVEAQKTSNGGVALVFATAPNFFIGQVTAEGLSNRPSENQVVNTSKLQLGELFSQEKLDRAHTNIKQLMEESGYYRSTLTEDLRRHPETQQVGIAFRMELGPQARIGTVNVTGDPGFSQAEVQDIAKMHSGDAVSSQKLATALDRLRKKYQKKNRWLAQVLTSQRTYRPAANAVDYTFDIQPGPVVTIETQGFKVSRRQLKRSVPVYEENALDDDLLNEGRRNLLSYLQDRGYFDAQVDFRKRNAANGKDLRVVYVIKPGASHKVVRVELAGNKWFSEEQLRPLMQVQPAGRLLSHGRFTSDLLDNDMRRIEAQYRDNGFGKVKVTSDVQDNYQGQENQLLVAIHIDEGPQTIVDSLHVTGNTTVAEDQLPSLNTGAGQPYSDTKIGEDREILLNYYFNRGFSGATFDANVKPVEGKPDRVDVTFTVHEGEQVFVDQVLLAGLNYTRPWVVERELQIKPKDPLSQLNMLQTQQQLYDLGIFSQVDTAVQNPEGTERNKTVLVNMQEAKRYTFSYGLGFEFQTGQPAVGTNQTPQGGAGVSPRVSFSVTRLNFRGRNHTLTFKTNVGRLQQRALVSAEIPRWFNSPKWKLSFTAFYDNTVDVTTFTSQRLEGSLQAQQNINKASTMIYSFTYRRVKATNLDQTISLDNIPLLSQPVRVGMPGFSYLRNTRDNDLETTKGTYTTIDAGVASGYFGSQADFSRFLFQNSTYHAFGKNRPAEKKLVFARSTRIGIENPYGNTVNLAPFQSLPDDSPLNVIPLAERFLSGGGNSHRGFGLNQAGPRDPTTGFPLGGSALFLNNLELRFPSPTLPFVGDNLRFAIFHDAGNVFTDGNNMVHSLLRWKQKDPQFCEVEEPSTSPNQCDYNYISHAIGIGVRYKTPIGPVRFDFGYNLNPPRFPSVDTSGPTPVFVPQQVRHFNVFFSIGQTF